MICMSRRSARSASPPSCPTSLPSNQTWPELGSISRRMQRPVVDLPQPELAHQAERLALADVEAHAVDGMHPIDLAREDAAGNREVLLEIADGEQRRLVCHGIAHSTHATR